jgi:allophanate hydrolase
VVQRLLAAGALLVGKTNLDQFATGLVGTRSPYGAPACVFNQAYVSGGSSSGSAVSVAAGIVAFALGSDTAGSGRVPAAFNGLIGFKPTRGRWSTSGLFPACRSIDCVTVFTHSSADARCVDAVLTAFDESDPYSRTAPAPRVRTHGERHRIGVPHRAQRQFFGDQQSARLFDQALDTLGRLDLDIVEVDIQPLMDAAQLLYAGPWVAERLAAIRDFLKRQPAAVHPVVRAIIQGGYAVSGVDTFEAMYRLQAYARDADRLWHGVDALVLPTAATAYKIAELEAEPVTLNSNLGLYTNFVNLLDMSAVSVPAGFRDNGTGFGVSLIGPAWHDSALLELAAQWEACPDRPTQPALDLVPAQRGVRLAVVGAHLSGMALHWQLSSRHARLIGASRTSATYRLFAMDEGKPQRPALVHVGSGGLAIDLELYELSEQAFGQFVSEVPAPLAIGKVHLESGETVSGFVAEPRALAGAKDISSFGGWRQYLAAL